MYSINDRGSTRGAAVSPNPLKLVNDSGVKKRLRKMPTRKLSGFGRVFIFSVDRDLASKREDALGEHAVLRERVLWQMTP